MRRYRVFMGNIAARVGALGAVFVATLVLARNGGPSVVGVYALLHVLPGLLGLVCSSGLPAAVAYFLAGPDRGERRLPFTIVAIAITGGTLGVLLWLAAAPALQAMLFPRLSLGLVALAGLLVLTRLVVTTAKSCSQGSEDLPGSNRVIFAEEVMFLPAYGLAWTAGVTGSAAVVTGMLLADVATSSLAWGRLMRRRFFRDAQRPSRTVARRVAAYGMRAQLGLIVSQLNLRLDYVLLTAFMNPTALGVYAVASKYAELVRIPSVALGYVLYPKFAREGMATAMQSARRLMPRAGLLTAGVAVPLWLAAGVAIPLVYGSAFEAAVVPAQIILVGLALDGVSGVITGFLYGVGRPGLTSLAMTLGLAVTVMLDVLLIPHFELVGAATASALAYITTTLALVVFYRRLVRAGPVAGWEDAGLSQAGVV
jgi:O-antigen/teichoic acid export membrane protein